MHCAPLPKIVVAWAIIAMLALSACGGGSSLTASGITSTTGTSPASAASTIEARADVLFAHARSLDSDDPEVEENVWELIAEAWTLVAQAARIRAEAAAAADNVDAAEAWTLAAEAAQGYAQAATALAAVTQDAGSDVVILPELPEVPTVVVGSGSITTSFGNTDLDHYPLDSQNVMPQEPQRPQEPELLACAATSAFCQERNDELLAAYHFDLENYDHGLGLEFEYYQQALEAYNAGQHREMVKQESRIASQEDVLEMLREYAYEVEIETDSGVELWSNYIQAHSLPPVVRFDSKTPGDVRAAAWRAIDNINAWLPWEKHITVGTDADLEPLEVQYNQARDAYARAQDVWNAWHIAFRHAENGEPGLIGNAVNGLLESVIKIHRHVAELNGEEFSLSHPAIVEVSQAIDDVTAIYGANRHSQTQLLRELQAGRDKALARVTQADSDQELAEDALYPNNDINVAYGRNVPRGSCGIGWSQGINIAEGCGSVALVQHELLHALGLVGGCACHEEFGADCDINSIDVPMFYYSHVPVSRFPESAMGPMPRRTTPRRACRRLMARSYRSSTRRRFTPKVSGRKSPSMSIGLRMLLSRLPYMKPMATATSPSTTGRRPRSVGS